MFMAGHLVRIRAARSTPPMSDMATSVITMAKWMGGSLAMRRALSLFALTKRRSIGDGRILHFPSVRAAIREVLMLADFLPSFSGYVVPITHFMCNRDPVGRVIFACVVGLAAAGRGR